MSAAAGSIRGSISERLGQGLLSALWVGIVPALMAGVVLRYLVPTIGVGLPGWIASVGHAYGLYFFVAMFLLFSGLARYWRYHVPGGRYSSNLPAHLVPEERDAESLEAWARTVALYERAGSRWLRRLVAWRCTRDEGEELGRLSGELRAAIEAGDRARAGDVCQHIERIAAPALSLQRWLEALGLVAALVVAVGATLLLRARVAQPYRVLSASMLPTLEPEDRIAGNKVAYVFRPGHLPRRGDVIVFKTDSVPLSGDRSLVPDELVKRVVGLPGDTITLRGSVPVINGWPVPTCDAGEYVYAMPDASGAALHGRLTVEFLDDAAYLVVHPRESPSAAEYTVAPGEVYVLGDNRGNSLDSRSYNGGRGGGVPLLAVEARAQWFLAGTHRSGDVDLGRLLSPVDTLQGRLRLEGLDADPVEAGVARCLALRPLETRPPPPGGEAASTRSGS
jgi:signal peptidase I